MQLGNPKAILFFTALLPQLINPEFSATIQFLVLGVVSIIVQGSTLIAYGWLAEKGGHWIKKGRFTRRIDRLARDPLIGAGVKLAVTSH